MERVIFNFDGVNYVVDYEIYFKGKRPTMDHKTKVRIVSISMNNTVIPFRYIPKEHLGIIFDKCKNNSIKRFDHYRDFGYEEIR